MLLSEMLTELRNEARLSTEVAHGSHLQARFISLLRRVQEEVYRSYDWPSLLLTQDVTVPAAARYVSYPSLIDFDGTRAVYFKTPDTDWTELAYRIRPEDLNTVDSETGEQRERIERWQNYVSPVDETLVDDMLEVWPIPSQDVQLRFAGKRRLLPLVSLTDASTVDGMIVVLHAAAEILAGQKAEDAPLKLKLAQSRYDQMRSTEAKSDNRTFFMSSGPQAPAPRRFRHLP